MTKEYYKFSCPCCGERLELDGRSGKARKVTVEEDDSLDSLLQQHKAQSDRLDSAFDSAKDKQKHQAEHLDDLLKRAKKDANENPDEEVRRPFDLD
ncbi:MAG: hypothetical protein VYE77_11015 [Planctomycetota bacterium]|nr:hypothetical protein [Planctomycetota bacterium]